MVYYVHVPILNTLNVSANIAIDMIFTKNIYNILQKKSIFRTKRQAEAICDIITSVLLGQEIRDVSQMLVGRAAVQFIQDLFL